MRLVKINNVIIHKMNYFTYNSKSMFDQLNKSELTDHLTCMESYAEVLLGEKTPPLPISK